MVIPKTTSFFRLSRGQPGMLKGISRQLRTFSSIYNAGFNSTRLPNGIRVASINNSNAPFCAAGVLLRTSGLTAQPKPNPKATASCYIMEKLAFKETSKINAVEMQNRLDGLVGAASSKSQRQSLSVSAAILPDQAAEALSLLLATTVDGRIIKDDLEEMKAVVDYEINELENKPDEFVPELVHGPAFYGDDGGQGGSILCIPETLKSITVEDVYEFRSKILTPQSLTFAASGIPHERFQTIALESINEVPLQFSNESESIELMKYQGGHQYTDVPDLPLIHVGIGFSGLPASHQDAYPLAVLQMLLGGGGSFSAGGPGKGMYSRLYTHVLNRYHWIESSKVFNFAYSNTGLFGIHGSALPSHAHELTMVMLNQLFNLADSQVKYDELERAKNQVKSAILMGLESRNTQLEDLTDQLINRLDVGAQFESPQEICEHVDRVQAEDLLRVSKYILSSSKPAVVAYGPLSKMPSYSKLCSMLE